MNRSEKRVKATKSYVLHFYTPSETCLNDFASTCKEIFEFLKIFRILQRLLLPSCYDGLYLRRFPGHFSKSSKYVLTVQH